MTVDVEQCHITDTFRIGKANHLQITRKQHVNLSISDLLLILVVFASFFTLIVASVQLRSGRDKQLIRLLLFYGFGLALHLGTTVIVSAASPQRVLETGEDWCFGDWCAAVAEASSADEVGSDENLALQQAYYLINNMLAPLPAARQELLANGAYFAIIGKDEQQTTLPEYSKMDSAYWDQRARGLGGGPGMPITSAGEENLLCLMADRYRGESIAVHEFAHTIANLGLGDNFEPLLAEFKEIYTSAQEQGLWDNTYAGSNIEEYWAEGVQTYFNTNLQSVLGDGVHNRVNTRKELAEYDPDLHAFIAKFFNDFYWTPTCP